MNRSELVLKAVLAAVRENLPDGVEPDDLDGFARRNWPALISLVTQRLQRVPRDLLDPKERTEANIRAMSILAAHPPPYSSAERSAIAAYSGWGGLSIQKQAAKFPAGFPVPKAQGLVHEYYTPTRVWAEVARSLLPFRKPDMRALEPSAGIGRAIRAFEGWDAKWTAVEYSPVSSRLLRALFDAVEIFEGPFEQYAADHPSRRWDLVISNPPYGPRGASAELDPDPKYATKRAYVYFVRRTLDLLVGGGIGAYIVPTGLLTSKSAKFLNTRERILRRHHLLAAFRLPSQAPEGGTVADVVYDQFVTDLLIFQSRGGELPTVDASDAAILAGDYFAEHPSHVLGKPIGLDEGWEPGMPKPRRGFQVVGRFDRLPDWEPRPMRGEAEAITGKKPLKSRGGLDREIRSVEGLPADLDTAVRLGLRVDAFLAAIAKNDRAAVTAWNELHADLEAWRKAHGDPAKHPGLLTLARDRITGAERFLAVWRHGTLIDALAHPPAVEDRYGGDWNLPAIADWLYRQRGGKLTIASLSAYWKSQAKAPLAEGQLVSQLLAAGWCLDGADWTDLVPEKVYYTGLLWPKHDRAEARLPDPVAAKQYKRLREAIGWRSAPDIAKELTPGDSWLPLELVEAWGNETVGGLGAKLVRKDGLLQPVGDLVYTDLNNTEKGRTPGFTAEFLTFLGWANLDNGLWKPPRDTVLNPVTGKPEDEPIAEARRRYATTMTERFRRWFGLNPEWSRVLEDNYNRRLRGYVDPEYSADPLPISRWTKTRTLRPYQCRGARRLVENRTGLLAFDVGLGKTYTGLATLAMARQQGWARRPVVLVPNSIVWKWYRDFTEVLPDYRVLVIGSSRRVAKSGVRKGKMVADTDTPAERAQKWSEFQAGGADAVLLTYSALARTKIDPAFVEEYVGNTVALRRSIAMTLAQEKVDTTKLDAAKAAGDDDAVAAAQRERQHKAAQNRAKQAALPTERKLADVEERVRGWIGSTLAPTKGWDYDPGIDWHALGIDFLMVDEAQNFKNLFASVRDGEKKDTKRSWALDFRCASVRAHSGGGGVVLLSATPAKNNPVEFYTMLHYLHPNTWAQVAVDNHEAFLNRYGVYKLKNVPDASGTKLVEREVFAGWKNEAELANVVYRWSEFKTAEEVGIKLPAVVRDPHTVTTTPAQKEALGALYAELAEIEEKRAKVHGKDEKANRIRRLFDMKKLGIAQRIYLTYLHHQLPGIGNDKAAIGRADPHDAPKLVECANQVLASAPKACRPGRDFCLDCSHIIFCDNTAVHYWMRALLVEKGIPEARIAILNADEAKDVEYRMQVVEGFNGVGYPEDDTYVAPIYDVVIANQVAYEGLDLQRRTCAIHHLDVPWEPATLQQRNGRGVRSGNEFEQVVIHYYFVAGSNENHRVQRIENKRNWLSMLVAGQKRATNTTTERDMSEEEMEDAALAHARPEDRERILKARRLAKQQEEARQRRAGQIAANRDLQSVRDLYRRADRERDAERAGLFRAEADRQLAELAHYPSTLWEYNWHERARRVRDCDAYVPQIGPPLCPGDRIRFEGRHLVEIQRVGATEASGYGKHAQKPASGVWFRLHGNPYVNDQILPDETNLRLGTRVDGDEDGEAFRHVELDVPWPDEPEIGRLVAVHYGTRSAASWVHRHWERLGPMRQEAWWPLVEAELRAIEVGYSGNAVPTEQLGSLVLLQAAGTRRLSAGKLVPATNGGWARFLTLAKSAGDRYTWTELNEAARTWWGRAMPKGAT